MRPACAVAATQLTAYGITVLPVTVPMIRNGWRFRLRHALSHWDATLIAAALELGCHTLYSEDLKHGQVFDGVRVINPFL